MSNAHADRGSGHAAETGTRDSSRETSTEVSSSHHFSSADALKSAGRRTGTPLPVDTVVLLSSFSSLSFSSRGVFRVASGCVGSRFRAPASPADLPADDAEAAANAAARDAASTTGADAATVRPYVGYAPPPLPDAVPEGPPVSRSDRRMASSRSAAASSARRFRASVAFFSPSLVRLRLCSGSEAGDRGSLPARGGPGSRETPAASAPSPELAPRCCAFACCSDIASAW